MTVTLTADHRYIDTETGAELPGTTNIIRSAGLMGNFMPDDPFYRERGTAIHMATELHDKGTLDEASVDPQIAGYLAAWRQYRTDTGFAPTFIEKSLGHPLHRYCGTLDRNGLDIKSGAYARWHVLQAAAYSELEIANGFTHTRTFMTVYLQEDGHYRVKVYSATELRDALRVFMAALAVYNWIRLR